MPLDARLERIARNEARFRDINERLAEGLRRVHPPADFEHFICECGQRSCQALIELSLDEYAAVRANARRFAVLPGHAIPDAERVVAHGERYDVLEKTAATHIVEDSA
jgi:hypothetical protein